MSHYRLLKPDEYNRLAEVPDFAGTYPNPESSVVIIQESDDGELEALLVAEAMIHLEPFWVAEPLRGSGGAIFKSLLPAMFAYLNHRKVGAFITTATSEQSADYLKRLGLRELPGIQFVGLVPEPFRK